jgi:hypothetical protein
MPIRRSFGNSLFARACFFPREATRPWLTTPECLPLRPPQAIKSPYSEYAFATEFHMASFPGAPDEPVFSVVPSEQGFQKRAKPLPLDQAIADLCRGFQRLAEELARKGHVLDSLELTPRNCEKDEGYECLNLSLQICCAGHRFGDTTVYLHHDKGAPQYAKILLTPPRVTSRHSPDGRHIYHAYPDHFSDCFKWLNDNVDNPMEVLPRFLAEIDKLPMPSQLTSFTSFELCRRTTCHDPVLMEAAAQLRPFLAPRPKT